MSDDWVVVPAAALSAQALNGLIEQYVLREGTEYGARDYSLQEKVRRVQGQLESGRVLIVYSDELGVAELITATDFSKRSREGVQP